MKIGRDLLSEDVERVAAMRDLVGPETALMVDANMRWTVEQAIAAARALAPFGVYWLEEPIEPDDYAGHRRVATAGRLPVAAGENLRTVREFAHLIVPEAWHFRNRTCPTSAASAPGCRWPGWLRRTTCR